MQKYMKSAMPYHGVPGPLLRLVLRKVFADLDFQDADSWSKTVLYIWHNARFREERYAAIALCEWKKAKAFQTLETLPIYEEMIVTGAWWDVVDVLASRCVGLRGSSRARSCSRPPIRRVRASRFRIRARLSLKGVS